ncbi:hypothetical protein ACWGIN_31015 [Streptomyces sp. NPDC054861]
MSIETFRSRSNEPQMTSDVTPVIPGSFSVTSQMMQDAVRATGVSVGEGDHNQESLFSNPFKDGRDEALVINQGKALTYLERTDTSDTGWVQGTVEGVPALAEVVAVAHPSGDIYAVCSPDDGAAKPFSMQLVQEEQEDGTLRCTWKKGAEFDIQSQNARCLCVTYSPDAGPSVLGASSTAGGSCFVLRPGLPRMREESVPWSLYPSRVVAPGTELVGGGFLPFFPATGQKNVYVFYFLGSQKLVRYEESAGQVQGPYSVYEFVDQFCGSYYVPNMEQASPQGDVGCAFFDADYGYLIAASYMSPGHGLSLEATSIDDQIDLAAEARIWQDADGRLHLFANSPVSSEGNWDLRVLHQASWEVVDRGPQQALTPQWTSAQVAGAPNGIGGYDLLRSQDRIIAFDFNGDGKEKQLLAYRPGNRTAWVVSRKRTPGGFKKTFSTDKGLPGYDLSSLDDQVVAYDYKGTKSANYLLAYRPGAGKFSILQKKEGVNEFISVVAAETGGIGEPGDTYNLANRADRIVPFDYRKSGANDCLLAYRPGTGIAWVLTPQPGGTFHPEVRSQSGLGGFSLTDPDDIIVPLDFTGSGSNTHLLAYRPGKGKAYILSADGSGGFTADVASDSGIGEYNLSRPNDRLLPFDYTGLGKNNHILAYRPGAPGQFDNQRVWILQPDKEAATRYTPLVKEAHGLGGYDFSSPDDLVTGYDYNGTGSMAYIAAYRPGTGKISVMGQRGGKMHPVYQVPPGPSTIVTVGLHHNPTAFQLDPYPDYRPSELIKMSGLTDAEAYCICTQDITTSEWQTDKVRVKPDDKAAPFIVSHYVADTTLLSTQGAAMAGHKVTVSAESLVEVQIEEVSYQVGPGRAVSVTTNRAGKLTITIAARGLNPPIVHLNADGLEGGTAIDFASQANSFLAGEGTLPSQRGTFSADLLEHAEATPNTGTNEAEQLADWKALKARGLTPDVVVDHCGNMYSRAAGSSQLKPGGNQLMMTFGGQTGPQPVHGYVIQLWDEDRPAFQVFRNQEEVEAYKAYRGDHPAYGGWWDDFTSWSSDVWEGIKTGAQKIAEVIVTDVVEIAVLIGNAVVSLGEMIIDGIEAAVRAVEAVFQMIANAIMRVIEWLKSLFALDAIWDTKEALEQGVRNTASMMTTSLTFVEKYTDGWIQEQKEQVTQTFKSLTDRYAGTRMGDFQNKVEPAPASSGASLERKDLSSPQGAWFANKTLSAPSPTLTLKDMADPPMLAEFEELIKSFTGMTSLTKIINSTKEIEKAIADFFTLDGDDQTGRSTFEALLNRLRDFILEVLDVVNDLIKALIKFAKAGAKSLGALLDYPLPLPIVDTLYQWVQRTAYPTRPTKPLTVGGFAFLIAGFFATTVHKLINGVDSRPFPGGTFPTIPGPPKDGEEQSAVSFTTDPDFNQDMVGIQATGVPWAVLQALGVALTDLVEPILDEVFKVGVPVLIGINTSVALINGYQSLVLGCPPILGSQWTGLAIGGYALSAVNVFLDLVGGIAGPWIPTEWARSTLLKNAAMKFFSVGDEDNITVGSSLQCAIGVVSVILQCVDLKNHPPTTRASTGVAWVAASMSHLHNVGQIFRMIALNWPEPEDEKLKEIMAARKNGIYIGTTVADVIFVATGDMAIGVPPCIALDHAPRITNGGTSDAPKAIPDGTAGQQYSQTVEVTAEGADVPINSPLNNWQLVDLDPSRPSGLTIVQDTENAAKANISGTPLATGDFTFRIQVWDSYSPPLCSYSKIARVHEDKPYFTIHVKPS